MQNVRVNALSYVSRSNLSHEGLLIPVLSAFLAVKYASLAMMKVSPECGKPYGGGSIVLVASGGQQCFPRKLPFFDSTVSFSCWSSVWRWSCAL